VSRVRVLNRYLLHDYLVMFFMTLLVFTFVMCVGAVIQAVDLIARGVSPWIIVRAFTYNVPYILTFSIPMSAMTTVLLLFGRLSLDGEITAMRSSGLSMWQIISPVIFVSILLSILCVYLNITVAPNAHYARRKALANLGVTDPISLLEEGRFVREFPGFMIYVGQKSGHRVRDVVVYETAPGGGVLRSVRAQSGELSMPGEHLMQIDLYEVRIDQPDDAHPDDPTRTRTIHAQHYPVPLDFSRLFRKGEISKTKSSMTLMELTGFIRHIRERYSHLDELKQRQARMGYLVEANERLALSMSCFAFTLLGIPLGMKSRRRESSIGIGISLGVVFIFYFFIIIADALVKYPHWHPDLIVWIPVVLGESLGFYLIKRQD
jgi:lipopolysaccharide export system permease protein